MFQQRRSSCHSRIHLALSPLYSFISRVSSTRKATHLAANRRSIRRKARAIRFKGIIQSRSRTRPKIEAGTPLLSPTKDEREKFRCTSARVRVQQSHGVSSVWNCLEFDSAVHCGAKEREARAGNLGKRCGQHTGLLTWRGIVCAQPWTAALPFPVLRPQVYRGHRA